MQIMKRQLSFLCMAFLVSLAAMSQVKKTNLKVLYVGGHSDMETMGGASYDTIAHDKSVVERAAAWEQYLNQYFTTVKAVKASDYNYRMSYVYDVTIIDGNPQPVEPRRNIIVNGRYAKIIYDRYFPDDFDRPVITIAETSETVGRRIGVKNDWYCLCLNAHAYDMKKDHPIFNGPYKVKLTMTDRPTPEGAKEYAPLIGETLPEKISMWRVQKRGYITDRGFKVGMVVRPWGYEDSPEAEWISGGESAKSRDAMAIGRHANWLHWGFAASPADMTDEAKPVFANAVVYISKFAGQHIIARKLNQNIATRTRVTEMKHRVSREVYDSYAEMTERYNAQMKHLADSIKKKEAAGEQLTDLDKQYLMMAQYAQPNPTYEQFVQQQAGSLFAKFGTDVAAYAKYYTENMPYFYGSVDGYDLQLDEDAKSLGIPNNDKRILDRAITMWEKGEDVEKARRLLCRYTLLRYDNPKEWRAWLKKYDKQLFFTESGGWLWLVNSQDSTTPGNDYSILKYNEADAEKMAKVNEATSIDNPVQLAAVVESSGKEKTLVVKMKIHPGYHIYAIVSDKDPYIANTYDISVGADAKLVGELQKPAGRLLNSTGTVVYEGEVVFRQKFTGVDKGSITFTVNYQACDNHSCLQPMSKTIVSSF